MGQKNQMVIAPRTKVSQVIKNTPGTIEALVKLSPHFKKLRNPILRKMLAPRVTLAQAAGMGNVPLPKMLQALQGLGLSVDWKAFGTAGTEQDEDGFGLSKEALPEDKSLYHFLDVREDIKNGRDPLKKIMKAAKKTAPGEALVVINSFVPTPLVHVLGKKGFGAFVEKRDGAYHTFFMYLQKAEEETGAESPGWTGGAEWESRMKHWEGRMRAINVRNMEMPQPLVTILTALENLPKEKALFVYHKKLPRHLLPELQDRGFRYYMKEEAPGKVLMLIEHAKH